MCWPLFDSCHVYARQSGQAGSQLAWYGDLFLLFIMSPHVARDLFGYVIDMFVATGPGVSLMRVVSGYTVLVHPVFFLSSHVMASLYLGDTGCCESMFMPDGWVTSTTSFFFERRACNPGCIASS